MKVISICLDDIKEERVTTARNGKRYVNLVVNDKKESDQYGNNVEVYHSQTKEERTAKAARIYVGKGKSY